MTPVAPSSGAPMPLSRGAVEVFLPEAWAMGSAFGGALAAALANAAMTAFDAAVFSVVDTSVRFLHATPVGAVRIEFDVLASGRSYATVECRLIAGERVTAVALVTLASHPARVDSAPTAWRPEIVEAAPAALDDGLESVVDWRAASEWWDESTAPTEFRSWISLRALASELPLRIDTVAARYLVASDLIGPALVAAGIPLPFRIATVSLAVSTVALSTSPWLEQRIRVRSTSPDAVADLELRDPSGNLLATATQRAVVLSAGPSELPYSVTGFGWGRAGNIPVLVED